MVVGNGFIMNWYYQTHIGLDMRYFWKHILSIVPAMLPAVALGIIAVRLHTFTGYAGVVTFGRAVCGGIRRRAVSVCNG